MTRVLRAESTDRNIPLNAVAPGYTDTEILNQVRRPESRDHGAMRLIPSRRFVQSDEIASLVAFLASDDASTVPGHVPSLTAPSSWDLDPAK
jgi:NAD(P)-dependent dehydrogenase (short-subunit alcohol dehydrogenase family)